MARFSACSATYAFSSCELFIGGMHGACDAGGMLGAGCDAASNGVATTSAKNAVGVDLLITPEPRSVCMQMQRTMECWLPAMRLCDLSGAGASYRTNGMQQTGDVDALSAIWATTSHDNRSISKPEPVDANAKKLLSQMHVYPLCSKMNFQSPISLWIIPSREVHSKNVLFACGSDASCLSEFLLVAIHTGLL